MKSKTETPYVKANGTILEPIKIDGSEPQRMDSELNFPKVWDVQIKGFDLSPSQAEIFEQ